MNTLDMATSTDQQPNQARANAKCCTGQLAVWLTAAASLLAFGLASPAHAWGNHALAAYRVFENMPEVAKVAPVTVEPLEAFLKAQEKAIEKLLADQETWLLANVPNYPARPAALAFKANPAASDDARRLAFLNALRVAHDSRFALYYELDVSVPTDGVNFLRHIDVSTLPGLPNAPRRFVALKAGEPVVALKVLASGSFEPDFGLDINLFDDNPGNWGRTYAFGKLPFGNPKLNFSSQAPFHMGFYQEDKILYVAAPFLKRTFPLVRVNQFAELSALAFKSGHPYWGWRFAGLTLHYVQDLSQPYHASVSPGSGTVGLLITNALAMAGFPKQKEETITLLSNRHLALERYQGQVLQQAVTGGAARELAQALGNVKTDAAYPVWSPLYLRDVVAREAYAEAAALADVVASTLPASYVNDPAYDFGANAEGIDLYAEIARIDASRRQKLDAALARLLTHFGAHSRNAVRGILKAAGQ